VIEFPLRLIAIVCSLLIVCSFGLFARDQLSGASHHQQAVLDDGPSGGAAPPKAKHHQPRVFIDDATKQLESPFTGFVSGSSSDWVREAVPALLALLLWGAGVGFLARFIRGRPGHTTQAATNTPF